MANYPEVSVVIPMYNAGKFIPACLESILAQTFQNFEVVVVDDCSTDDGALIVENYLEKFDGRLKLLRMEKNSGAGVSRNKGLRFSRGEYIFFMDADDLITPNAFEELFTLAKSYDADVVYCERYYEVDSALENIELVTRKKNNFIDKPIIETDNMAERVQKIIDFEFLVYPWVKFLKRDFLIENEIIFPNIIREDDVWTWNLIFHAKKFLRVPNAVYAWRQVETSSSRRGKTLEQQITFWINPVIRGVKTLHEIMSRIEFFNKNPQASYELLRLFAEISFAVLLKGNVKPFEIYETVLKKFSKELGERDILIALLCSLANTEPRILLTPK